MAMVRYFSIPQPCQSCQYEERFAPFANSMQSRYSAVLASCPLLPAFYFGEVINVLWMRRGDRDRGSPLPLMDAKNMRLKLSFARVMTAAREMLMMMMTPRDISTVQEGDAIMIPRQKCLSRGGVIVAIGAFRTRPLNLVSLPRNLAMIRQFSRLTFRHSLARSPALDTLFCQSRMATLRLTD